MSNWCISCSDWSGKILDPKIVHQYPTNQTKKHHTRRSSLPTRLWTPVLLMTLLLATALGIKKVFDEIGHIAGALSYQHVVITVNLSSLSLQAKSLNRVIHFYEDQICDTYHTSNNANATMYKPIEKVQYYAIHQRSVQFHQHGRPKQCHQHSPQEHEVTQILDPWSTGIVPQCGCYP